MTRLPFAASIRDVYAAAVLLVLTLLVFWFSPVHQVTDSHYSILLSESLLKHRSFTLDHFNLPRLEPNASTRDYYVMNGDIWQLELAKGRIYYYFPAGSSVLSLPFVAIANGFGISAAHADGTYNPRGEIRIETTLAAVLMALATIAFYFTSRLLLPELWSVVIALGGALGTQIWSTASRGLWSHTWATLLSCLILYLLLAAEARQRKLLPIFLASLCAWLYFVRPSGSIVAGAVTVYILTLHREEFLRFALTGALWLTAFVTYSWLHFGKSLPSYYQTARLRLDLLPVALAGNLVSPSRGWIVYVPVLLYLIYLLLRYWTFVPWKGLVWLSLVICTLHMLLVSAFANLWGDWWGGASFGPRYTTELIPWTVLLAVLAIKGRTLAASSDAAQNRFPGRQVENICGALLLILSVFINAQGALSVDTWKWSQPATDQQLRSRLWDWSRPQFLAGFQEPPQPLEFPLLQLNSEIHLTSSDGAYYLWYGWSGAEENSRWTDGKSATLIFADSQQRDLLFLVKMAPFLFGSELAQQRWTLKLNDHSVQALVLLDSEVREYSVKLPVEHLKIRNVLTFELPDASSPSALKAGSDDRLLGVRVESIRFQGL